MTLINCQINLIFTWSANCAIFSTDVENQSATFSITETNLYVPVVPLLIHDNARLFQKLNSDFKKPINWNKYTSTIKLLRQNRNLTIKLNQFFNE